VGAGGGRAGAGARSARARSGAAEKVPSMRVRGTVGENRERQNRAPICCVDTYTINLSSSRDMRHESGAHVLPSYYVVRRIIRREQASCLEDELCQRIKHLSLLPACLNIYSLFSSSMEHFNHQA
jgi:hypothetical protein